MGIRGRKWNGERILLRPNWMQVAKSEFKMSEEGIGCTYNNEAIDEKRNSSVNETKERIP